MKKYPFKFLDSYNYNDTDIFFGRDQEIKALYEMVFQSSILLVYGASGTGKTSLIQCGLAGKFKSYDWLALTVRRGNNINTSLEKVLNDAGGNRAGEEDDGKDEKILTGLSKQIRNVYLNNFKPVYLIFDQFEELYILGSKEEQDKFIISVKELLTLEQPVKLIISIREEYLGYLYDFERAVPQLLRKKLRVEPMNIDKVTDVLTGINNHKNSNVHIKDDEIAAITEGIFNRLKGPKKSLTIQLPYLQVFLDKLYLEITADESRQKDALITNDTLVGMGDIGDVLRDFLESQVKSISDKKSSASKPVSTDTIWKILSPFSTLEGTKQPILLKDLLEQLKGKENITETLVKECVIEEFALRRILNSTDTTDQFELTHDTLAKTIAGRRTDEEIALLEIRRLIKNQVSTNVEAREYFTEKQLNFIEPQRARLENLSKQEETWIDKSRRRVESEKIQKEKLQKKQLKRARIVAGVILLLAIGAFAIAIYSYKLKKIADSKTEVAIRQTALAQQHLLETYESEIKRYKKDIDINTINLSSFKGFGASDVAAKVSVTIDSLDRIKTSLINKRDSLLNSNKIH